MCRSVIPPVYLPVCLYISLRVSPCVNLCVHQCVCACVRAFVGPSVGPLGQMSMWPSGWLYLNYCTTTTCFFFKFSLWVVCEFPRSLLTIDPEVIMAKTIQSQILLLPQNSPSYFQASLWWLDKNTCNLLVLCVVLVVAHCSSWLLKKVLSQVLCWERFHMHLHNSHNHGTWIVCSISPKPQVTFTTKEYH